MKEKDNEIIQVRNNLSEAKNLIKDQKMQMNN